MAKELIPPTDDSDDHRHFLARQLVGLLPVPGVSAGEWFGWLCAPPIQKRLEQWRNDVALALIDQIRRMENAEFAIQQLQSNESFISTVMAATRVASTTHETAKLEALRNAVLNTAAGIHVAEVERHMFLRYVDELSELHIRVLAYGNARTRPPFINNILDANPALFLSEVFKELSDKAVVANRIWDDLVERSLIKWGTSSGSHRSVSYWREEWTTEFGRAFLGFISSPDESHMCQFTIDTAPSDLEAHPAITEEQRVELEITETVRSLAADVSFKERVLSFNTCSREEQVAITTEVIKALFARKKVGTVKTPIVEYVLRRYATP